MALNFDDVKQSLESVQPRFFDTYILGPFLVWYGIKSGGAMNKNVRRIMVSAGIWTLFRNWKEYGNIQAKINEFKSQLPGV